MASSTKFRRGPTPCATAFLCLCAALSLTLPALTRAAGTPPDQPVEVRADQATFEQEAGTGVYQGHAELIQGDRHLYADTIRLFANNKELTKVEATGNPVHMVEGDQFDATADKLVYDLQTHMLILTGNAHIKHQGSTFEGAEVKYNLESKRVDANGKDGKRVRLVIPAKTEETIRNDEHQKKGQTPPANPPGQGAPNTETH